MAVTPYPTAEWTARRIVECCAWDRWPLATLERRCDRLRLLLQATRNKFCDKLQVLYLVLCETIHRQEPKEISLRTSSDLTIAPRGQSIAACNAAASGIARLHRTRSTLVAHRSDHRTIRWVTSARFWGRESATAMFLHVDTVLFSFSRVVMLLKKAELGTAEPAH